MLFFVQHLYTCLTCLNTANTSSNIYCQWYSIKQVLQKFIRQLIMHHDCILNCYHIYHQLIRFYGWMEASPNLLQAHYRILTGLSDDFSLCSSSLNGIVMLDCTSSSTRTCTCTHLLTKQMCQNPTDVNNDTASSLKMKAKSIVSDLTGLKSLRQQY